jgi:hypothetical protein
VRDPAHHARPRETVEPRDLPLSILIIFTLLFITFDSVPRALPILLNVHFAMVGGGAVPPTGLTLFLLPLIYPWFSSKDL